MHCRSEASPTPGQSHLPSGDEAEAGSAINKGLDQALARFANRQLDEPYPYLILDARYEKVRDAGVIAHRAVLIAIGINWEGQRQVLAVELANRESQSSGKDFLIRLKERGLSGVEFVVSDDHADLKKAIRDEGSATKGQVLH